MTNRDEMREAFENWIRSRCPLSTRKMQAEDVLHRNKDGNYWLSTVDSMWVGLASSPRSIRTEAVNGG